MFFIVLSQSLIKFLPPSPVDVHTICLISGTTLNCVLAFYTSEYLLLFFFSLLVDPVLLPLRRPSDWSWGLSILQHHHHHDQQYEVGKLSP